MTRTEEFLSWMKKVCPDFVKAFEEKREASYSDPNAMFGDDYPSFDDDREEERLTVDPSISPWSTVSYLEKWRTENGKIYAVFMERDQFGNDEIADEVEIENEAEYDRCSKQYVNSFQWVEEWKKYYKWCVETGLDPLDKLDIMPYEKVHWELVIMRHTMTTPFLFVIAKRTDTGEAIMNTDDIPLQIVRFLDMGHWGDDEEHIYIGVSQHPNFIFHCNNIKLRDSREEAQVNTADFDVDMPVEGEELTRQIKVKALKKLED